MPNLSLDRHGFLNPVQDVKIIHSPNFSERPANTSVDLLVIHNISLPPGQFGGPYIEQLFTNTLDPKANPAFKELEGLTVSAHFLIRRDGQIMQFVSTDKKAWHAGASDFQDRGPCNPYSIGIELEGTDFGPFEHAQYVQLARLTEALKSRYPLSSVRGHEDIAPGRKTDPGPFFDWDLYMKMAGWRDQQGPQRD